LLLKYSTDGELKIQRILFGLSDKIFAAVRGSIELTYKLKRRYIMHSRWLLLVIIFLLERNCLLQQVFSKKIAIIGGGISGTFVMKYLVDYDIHCQQFESFTIFEPSEPKRIIRKTVNDTMDSNSSYQTSRIASYEMDDGTVVELGASVLYSGFHLVMEMIQNDPSVHLGEPFNTGKETPDPTLNGGLGIYGGAGLWSLLTSRAPAWFPSLPLLVRYNWDLVKLTRICRHLSKEFAKIPSLLSYHNPSQSFDSPDDIWKSMGAEKAVHSSFDQLLDVLGISSDQKGLLSYWYKYMPYQGSLRAELLDAMNLVNYNQDNAQVNGMVGLGSFVASLGGLYSVRGGNYQIIASAHRQALAARSKYCNNTSQNGSDTPTLHRVEKRVTTVVGDLHGLALFSENEFLGEYDIVILAAALPQCQITFLIQSQLDPAVLQPMPLGGRINAHDHPAPDDGHDQIPRFLPDSAMRPYTTVVTTIVRNAVLNTTWFHLTDMDPPKQIIMTVQGKARTHNITSITQISHGTYKLFSNEILAADVLQLLFGAGVDVEYERVWGGPFGGATPDYQGSGDSIPFLLYDGAEGLKGHTRSGALYYPNAMEQSSLACMEIAAIGSRAVAKLIAERVGLLEERIEVEVHDEL
jgi:prenylcysteine oxidase / farnesylcysteine lyase